MSITTDRNYGISGAIMMDPDKWEEMHKKAKNLGKNHKEKTSGKHQQWIDHINKLIEKISDVETKASLKKLHTKYVEPILKMEQKDFIQEHISRLIEAYDSRMEIVLMEREKEYAEIIEFTEKQQKWIDHINNLIKQIPEIQTKKSLENFHAKYVEPIFKMKEKYYIQEYIPLLINVYDSRMKMVLLERKKEHAMIHEISKKQQKWIDYINTLIERILAIETTASLEKFHTKYIQPILEMDNNFLIQEYIPLLINAYDSRMKMIELEKENEVAFSPKSPPPEEFVRVFGKDEYVRVHGKTPPASPKTPPSEDFLRVFGKDEYVRTYKKSPPKKRKSAKTQKKKESEKINPKKSKESEKINPKKSKESEKINPKKSKESEKINPKKSKNAYAIVHFGSNPVYLELELYFFIMLRKYTKNDIIYLYSVNDTPSSFIDAVRPFVTDVVPFDDRGITYDVNFESGYSNFNTLRTCNFIFAYTLEAYEKVCIIESDMVIMGSIDSVFNLNAPAVLTYYIGDKQLKSNDAIKNDPKDVIAKCKEMGRTNGGVMLIEPSMPLFERYRDKIQDVVKHTCKYPNETLFEYVNSSYFNMPIQYNLSHFLAKPHIIKKYGLSKDEILVFHFNETKFKHIDIIKNPVDESGINWLENPDPKYAIKRNAVLHYKDTVYDKHPEISIIISKLSEKKTVANEEQPPVEKASPKKKAVANKCKDDEEINPETGRCRKVCPPGTLRNEKGKCVKTANKTQKMKECKDDEEINPETGRCRKVCPEGKVRNEKGNCVNPK